MKKWTKSQIYYLIKTKGKKDKVVPKGIEITKWGVKEWRG